MPLLTKFNCFSKDLAEKKHNLAADTLTLAFTSVPPSLSNTVIADITQINYANFVSSRNLTITTTLVNGIYTVTAANLNISVTANSPFFTHLVVYNSTTPTGPLIGYYDLQATAYISTSAPITAAFSPIDPLLIVR